MYWQYYVLHDFFKKNYVYIIIMNFEKFWQVFPVKFIEMK